MFFIGVDNGGTFTKAVVFDEKGREIAGASGRIPLLTPKAGHTERDMELLWTENASAIRQAIQKAGIDPCAIGGVGFSGHGKGLYLVDKDGKPARNGIVSTDSRAHEYPARWMKDGTADKLFPMTCQKVLACQPVSLLSWLAEHEPESLERTQWIMGVKDYVRYCLTGEAFAEITDFSGSNLVNLKTVSYDPAILKLLGLEAIAEKLPPLKYSGEICGRVTAKAAELTGLPAGTPCAAGMFDIDACAIAMGVTTSESIAAIAGTWSINEYIADSPILDKSIMMNSLYCIPGRYLIEESSPTGAGNHEWFINMFLGEEKERCAQTGENVYALTDKMAESVGPDEQNIVFLPYIFGGNDDPQAKAALIGMDSHHTRAHVVRAVFEGVAFCHMLHIERLLRHRKHTQSVRLAGGVCNSKVWVQIFADVFNLPVETVRVKELGALGGAMSAAVATGQYKDFTEATEHMTATGEAVMPNSANAEIYRKKFNLFKETVSALAPLWGKHNEL